MRTKPIQKNIQMKVMNAGNWEMLFPKTKAALVDVDGKLLDAVLANIQKSIDGKITPAEVDAKISTAVEGLLGGVSEQYNTLKKIADKLTQNDADLAGILAAIDTKVNKTDVVNDLATTEAGKVLDARQGKVLKDLVDTKASSADVTAALATKSDVGHGHAHTEIEGLGTAATKDVGKTEGQLVAIGAGNKIDMALLPSVAINETFVVATVEEAMAATVQNGDIVIINATPAQVRKPASEMLLSSLAAGVNTFIVVDAVAEEFDGKFRPLVSNADAITKGEVVEALAKKLDVTVYTADKAALEAEIAKKANSADVYTKTEVNAKETALQAEDTRIEGKFDAAVATINEGLATKADTTYVNAELAKKANVADMETELAKKADKTVVEEALATKADKTYVDETMATKAEVALKADKTYVDEELAKKGNVEEINAALDTKADKATTYTKKEVDDKFSGSTLTVSATQPEGKLEGHVWLELS